MTEKTTPARTSRRALWLVAAIGAVALTLAAIGGGWLRGHRTGLIASGSPGRPARAQAEIRIQGMDCMMCAAGLQNKLRGLPGVSKAEVSYQDQRATVEFDPAVTSRARIEAIIKGDGFKPLPSESAPPQRAPAPAAR